MYGTFRGDVGEVQGVILTLSFNFKDLSAARKENVYKHSWVFAKHIVAKEWKEVIITKRGDSGNTVINTGVTAYYLSPF